MPPTEELRCTDESCFMDMFDNHYTFDVPDDLEPADLQCPACGGSSSLERIEL